MIIVYGLYRYFNCIDNVDLLFIVGIKIGLK